MLKKNIAKLLVFAMILSMLPFSAVSVGAVTPRNGEKDGGGYALISDAYVLGTDSKQLKLDKKTGLGTTENPYTLTADSYIVVDDTNNSVTLNFEVNNNTNSIYDLGSDVTNWSLSGKTGNTVPTNKWVTKTITPTIGNDGSAKVKACYAVYSNSKDATCYQLEFTAKKLYTVAVGTCMNGTLTVSANKAVAGAEISVTATPTPGYKLQEISVIGANVAVQNGKFTMPASNVTVNATFVINSTEKKEYAISSDITPANSGSVTFTVGNNNTAVTQALDGAQVTAAASAKTGYTFKSMSGTYTLGTDTELPLTMTEGNSANVYTFTMPAGPVKVKAEFETVQGQKFTVEVGDMVGGHLEFVNDVYEYAKDADVIFKAVPDMGWSVTKVTYTVGSDADPYKLNPDTDENYSFKMPPDDVKVDAVFTKIVTEDVTLSWTSAPELLPKGKLVLENTKTGKYYVVQVSKGDASVMICMEGSKDGSVIEIPCAPSIDVEAWETEGYTEKDILAVDSFEYFQTNQSNNMKVNRPSSQSNTDSADSDDVIPYAEGDVKLTWASAPELLPKGKLVLEDTKGDKYYVVQVSKGDASVMICMEGSKEGSVIEIPCAPSIDVEAWETEGYTEKDILAVDSFEYFQTNKQ